MNSKKIKLFFFQELGMQERRVVRLSNDEKYNPTWINGAVPSCAKASKIETPVFRCWPLPRLPVIKVIIISEKNSSLKYAPKIAIEKGRRWPKIEEFNKNIYPRADVNNQGLEYSRPDSVRPASRSICRNRTGPSKRRTKSEIIIFWLNIDFRHFSKSLPSTAKGESKEKEIC